MWPMWMVPLTLSCPRHGCWLEACWGPPGTSVDWKGNTQAELFLPGTGAEPTLDRLMRILRRKAGKGWQEGWKMVHDATADAQHDPERAWALYALASRGKRHDPVALERVRPRFIAARVPAEFLPHEDWDTLSAL